MKNNVREINFEEWHKAQKELESAKNMFNWATEHKYIDIAIEFENIAMQKLYNLRKLHHANNINTNKTEVENKTKKSKTLLDKALDFLLEPYYELKEIQKSMKEESERKIFIKDLHSLNKSKVLEVIKHDK